MQRGPSARLKQISQKRDLLLDVDDRLGERPRVEVGGAQHVEREPLGGAVADPRQLRQLGDEPLEGRGEQRGREEGRLSEAG